MRCLETRLVGTRADAVRDLIKPVAQRLGADLDRLKQDVVFWVARHTLILSLCRAVFIREGLAQPGEELVSYSRSNGAGQAAAAPNGARRRAEASARASELNNMSVTVVQINCVQCKLTCKRMEAAVCARPTGFQRGLVWRVYPKNRDRAR